MSLAEGACLGPYQIVSLLGRGGMGEVWRARDTRLNRDVAVKVSAQQFNDRFLREARVVAGLSHANICTLFDVGPNYLVMELIEGPTLADRIGEGAIPIDEALVIARQIAAALEAAHDKGVVHRDLKPANIKVSHDGSVKVLDFGLAKSAAESGELSPDSPTMLSATGIILGTAGYMAPEQARGKPVDKRADIFAFGVVLYEMVTGQRAFAGETVSDTLVAIIKEDPEWARVPERLQRVLRKCLEKDPKKRLRDITGFDLLLEETAAEGRPATPVEARTNRLWPAVAGILALVLVIAVWAWSPWRAAKPADRPLLRLETDLGEGVDILRAPGGGSRFILSPDGTRLVYMSAGRLYTRRLDESGSRELKGAEGASAPFFSPDGKWVAFSAATKLVKMPVEGGAATLIANDVRSGGSWGDDGTIVFGRGDHGGLGNVSSAGGTPARLTALAPGEVTHNWPQVLPGSRAVLFTANAAIGDGFRNAKIKAVSLKDGSVKTILERGTYGRYVPAAGGPGYLLYANDGMLLAVPFDPDKLEVRGDPVTLAQNVATGTGGAAQYDFSRNGTLVYKTGNLGLRDAQWMDASGKSQQLGLKPDYYSNVSLSRDGKRLVLNTAAGDILVYDTQRDAATRLTFGEQYRYPVWGPDDRFIVFSGDGGMFWTRSDGAGKPQPLTQSKYAQRPSGFTRDGKRLAFVGVDPAYKYEIMTVPVENDGTALHAGTPESFLPTLLFVGDPVFSPDGRWIAYGSNELGVTEIFVRAFPDKGGKWQISSGGGSRPRWSQDGHELFFLSGDGRSVMAASFTAKNDSFGGDKPRVWLPPYPGALVSFDVTADGKHVVTIPTRESENEASVASRVTFLLNFTDELGRRTAATK
jgi:serine/threonine-protein kinase